MTVYETVKKNHILSSGRREHFETFKFRRVLDVDKVFKKKKSLLKSSYTMPHMIGYV